jgi:outer membrane protein TolC
MSFGFFRQARRIVLVLLVGLQGMGLQGQPAISAGLPAQTASSKPSWQTADTQSDFKPATILTWDECVRLTADNNPSLEASRNNVLNSDAVRKASYSNLYPQISASLGGSRNYKEVKNPGLPSTSDYSNSFSAQLSLTQTIFDGLRTQGNIDSAKAQLAYSYASLNSQKAATSYALKSAFAQLLFAQELVETNRQILQMRQQNERLIGLRYEGGSENKGNWLSSIASRDQAQFALNQSVRNREVSELQLLTIIGKLDIPRPILVQGTLRTNTLPATPDFSNLALQTPAYFQYRSQVDAAHAGVRIAQSNWWPTISASVSGGESGSSFFPNSAYAGGGIGISYDLFDGGSTYFNVAASEANLRQTLANLRGGTNQATLTLAQAFKSYVDAVENLPVQKEQLDSMELLYKIYEMRYNIGQVGFKDFNDTTNSYVSQQTIYLTAQRDAVIQEANWEQARGVGALP